MTNGESLLAYCYEHPEDDSARLVYADWLEEKSDTDRAEFVRLQVELAGLCKEHPDRDQARDRSRELLRIYGEAWRKRLPGWAKAKVIFVRGFPTTFDVTAAQLLKQGKSLRRQATIHGLRLRKVEGKMPEVFASGFLAGIRALDFSYAALTSEDIAQLVRCPDLVELRELTLGRVQGGLDASAMARSPYLEHLEVLDVFECESDLAKALADPAVPFRLRRLRVSYPASPLIDLTSLARSRAFSRIEDLEFQTHDFAEGQVIEFLNALSSDHLRRLNLLLCGLTDNDLQVLASSLRFSRLQHLSLAGNYNITSAGAVAIARSQHFGRLITLDLDDNPIQSAGVIALADSKTLPALRGLRLSHTKLTSKALTALSRAPWLRQLANLDLSFNEDLTATGFQSFFTVSAIASLRSLNCWQSSFDATATCALAASPYLGMLRELDLGCNSIGPEGAEAIARSTNLPSLRSLNLTMTDIGDRGGQAMVSSPLLDQLSFLAIDSNRLNKSTRIRLREKQGDRDWQLV